MYMADLHTNPAGLSDKKLKQLRDRFEKAVGSSGRFKIDEDSKVTSGSNGHLFCTTTPTHPEAMKLEDRNKRYVFMHRVVMENTLGRLIDPDREQVHHKNGKNTDNRPSNLELLSYGSHAKETEFWKDSPRTKPGQRRKAARVVEAFLAKTVVAL